MRPAAAEDEAWVYDRTDVLEAWKYGGPGVREAAAIALAGSDQDVQTFMTQDLPNIWEDDLRVQVAQVMGKGGPAVRAAANTAMDGTATQLQAFLDTTLAPAHDEDLRVRVSTVMATGGPGVKAAGGVRDLSGAEEMVRAGATRIGASAGVKIVQESKGAPVGAVSTGGY